MKVEKFSKDGVEGIRLKDAVFAASKNYNGCHFDPMEVFSVDNPPEDFNLNHGNQTVKFSWESKPTAEIDGKMIKFKADLISTDPYAIENAEKFSGLSPELQPVNQPARRGTERFYAVGDLVWRATAVLEGQKPGFVGADRFELEKFSVNEDVLIVEKREEPKPEPTPKKEPKPESFKNQTMSITEEEMQKIAEKTAEIMAEKFNLQTKPEEGEEPKPEEQKPKEASEEDEKFAAIQSEVEKFNQLIAAKGKVAKVELFAKGGESGDKAKLQKAKQSYLSTF